MLGNQVLPAVCWQLCMQINIWCHFLNWILWILVIYIYNIYIYLLQRSWWYHKKPLIRTSTATFLRQNSQSSSIMIWKAGRLGDAADRIFYNSMHQLHVYIYISCTHCCIFIYACVLNYTHTSAYTTFIYKHEHYKRIGRYKYIYYILVLLLTKNAHRHSECDLKVWHHYIALQYSPKSLLQHLLSLVSLITLQKLRKATPGKGQQAGTSKTTWISQI